MIKDYSENELKLLRHFGVKDSLLDDPYCSAPNVYDKLALDLFMRNERGEEVESIRRIVIALHKCNPYRKTPEFEALIKFTEKEPKLLCRCGEVADLGIVANPYLYHVYNQVVKEPFCSECYEKNDESL